MGWIEIRGNAEGDSSKTQEETYPTCQQLDADLADVKSEFVASLWKRYFWEIFSKFSKRTFAS